MKLQANRVAGSALAVLTLPAMGGCSGVTGHACTLIGAESGIVVTYDEVRQAHPRQPLRVEVCVDDDCQTQLSRGVPSIHAGGDIVHDASAVEVSVTISDGDGTTVFDAHTSVTPEKWQPNGSGCEPTVWFGGVEATADGQLHQVPRH